MYLLVSATSTWNVRMKTIFPTTIDLFPIVSYRVLSCPVYHQRHARPSLRTINVCCARSSTHGNVYALPRCGWVEDPGWLVRPLCAFVSSSIVNRATLLRSQRSVSAAGWYRGLVRLFAARSTSVLGRARVRRKQRDVTE